MNYSITENDQLKVITSDEVHYVFNKKTGFMATWGKTKKDNPEYSKIGPFIADIEVTDICRGLESLGGPCPWCYKGNTTTGKYMTFNRFKTLFDSLPNILTQIAFGVDAQCESNPDIWKILYYTRDNGVIPNMTVADISVDTAKELVKVCGAIAVSWYGDWDTFYNTITNLYDAKLQEGSTLKDINIHCLLSEETYGNTIKLLEKWAELKEKVNAIVFLSLKKKGRGVTYNNLSQDKFCDIVKFCMDNGISYGFDSCSANKVVKVYKALNIPVPMDNIEPCESTRFSVYFSVDGKFYPCSFCENVFEGTESSDFMRDIWYSKIAENFRKSLASNKDENGCEKCPIFKI